MINMERTLMAPGFDNTEADQKRGLATWSHPSGFEKLDTIHTSEEALNDMVAMFETMEDRGIDLLEKPALPEFTLSAREPAPLRSPRSVLVRFKRSAMRDAVTVPVGDDCTQITKPVIDGKRNNHRTLTRNSLPCRIVIGSYPILQRRYFYGRTSTANPRRKTRAVGTDH